MSVLPRGSFIREAKEVVGDVAVESTAQDPGVGVASMGIVLEASMLVHLLLKRSMGDYCIKCSGLDWPHGCLLG